MKNGDVVYLCRSSGDPWKCILLSDPDDFLYVLERVSDGYRFGPYPRDRVKSSPDQCGGHASLTVKKGDHVLVGAPAESNQPSWPAVVLRIYDNGRLSVKMDGLGRAQTVDPEWIFPQQEQQ